MVQTKKIENLGANLILDTTPPRIKQGRDDLKFNCKMCGRCCKMLKNTEVEDKTKLIKNYPFLKIFDVKESMLVPLLPLMGSVPLFPWERKRLLELSKGMKLKISILPSDGIYNKNEKIIGIYIYALIGKKCPFLTESNKCAIYNNQPLYCRGYPIKSAGLLGLLQFGYCPNKVDPFPKDTKVLDKKEGIRQLIQTYGDTFISAARFELLMHDWLSFLVRYHNWNIFLPEDQKQLLHFKNRIKKVDVIDHFLEERVVEKGVIDWFINHYLEFDVESKLDTIFEWSDRKFQSFFNKKRRQGVI